MALVQFLFIVAVPLVVVAGAVVTLFAVGALFDALDHPEDLSQRIEGLFRQPEPPARALHSNHYYSAPWTRTSTGS